MEPGGIPATAGEIEGGCGARREPADDEAVERAVAALRGWFRKNRKGVFYSRQLEIIHERPFFHWVTNAAIRQLAKEGEIKVDQGLPGQPKVLYHRLHRYPRRQITALRDLIAEHSVAEKNHAIGDYCEDLVERAFFRAGFRFVAQKVKELGPRKWTETNHDLDFVFERDELRYGIEVKNTLGYSNLGEEVAIKTRLARHLGCQPLFVARWLPKSWNHKIITADGLVLLFEWQLQPTANQGIANRMKEEMHLPVKVARNFPDGDMQRFLRSHAKLVKRLRWDVGDKDGVDV